jgi:hypothetical protein
MSMIQMVGSGSSMEIMLVSKVEGYLMMAHAMFIQSTVFCQSTILVFLWRDLTEMVLQSYLSTNILLGITNLCLPDWLMINMDAVLVILNDPHTIELDIMIIKITLLPVGHRMAVTDLYIAVRSHHMVVTDLHIAVRSHPMAVTDLHIAVKSHPMAMTDLHIAMRSHPMAVIDLHIAVRNIRMVVKDPHVIGIGIEAGTVIIN